MWAAFTNQQTLINNDDILPSQFFAQARVSTGQQRLLLAILESAWMDLSLYVKSQSRHAQNLTATAWTWVQTGTEGMVPFNDACEHVGINPEQLRRGMERALERREALPSLRRASAAMTHKKPLGEKYDT